MGAIPGRMAAHIPAWPARPALSWLQTSSCRCAGQGIPPVAYSAVDGRYVRRPGAWRPGSRFRPGYQRTVQTIVLDGDTSLVFILEPVSIERTRRPFVRRWAALCRGRPQVPLRQRPSLLGLAHYGLSDPVRGAKQPIGYQATRRWRAWCASSAAQVSVEETRRLIVRCSI
ncbi:hypothetical protein [Candidatus Amarolinea aalborgensis]|uniref:hypothetical protein n=1 Tax=Candidatus Amarolinea aalborgensis TaxID=2249329 RepID=UPI003BFA2BE7